MNAIATQSSSLPVKEAEDVLGNNLLAHASTSLSKAHGMELLCVPTPFYDVYGNDVSIYTDSNSDLVGSRQMVLTDPVTLLPYYVPLLSSVLTGQPPLTGIPLTTPAGTGVQASAVWVTAAQTEAVAVENTNQLLLLVHTQQAHTTAHTGGVYAIIQQNTFDSAGHLVADHIASVLYNGSELLVPCSSRMGGPLQPPQLLGLSSYYALVHTTGTAADYKIFFGPTGVIGTQPLVFTYYDAPGLNSDGTPAWDMSNPVAADQTTTATGINGHTFSVSYSSTTGQFHISNGGGGGSNLYLLCTLTGPGGTTNVIAGTTTLCYFHLLFTHTSS